ncbi:ABC transporter permease subunit [Marinospirillum insulare]|uniref:ABC transporter permease n=1 Tax=Marinospirillum insulare TaxID=217169 RepID=A0ABQ5ZUG1_9GAMM|nr:ABC transporter permease subunit [Marinospirillum insulare]GLR63071.1 ABC transporter permease [Marinospirillum insulare]
MPFNLGLALLSAALLGLCTWLFIPEPELSTLILHAPNASHWLGTNVLGQDVLLRLLQALPNTFIIALMTGLLPVGFALLLASVNFFMPNWVDKLLLKLADLIMILPGTLLLILLAVFLEPDLWGSILLVSMLAWMDDFRILRTALFKASLRDNLAVAKSYAASKSYLLRQHLWPVLKPLLFALVIQNARRGVMMTAGLAFLGLMDPRLPNWGSLLFESQDQIHTDAFWWLLLPPVIALSCLLLFLTYLQQKVDRYADE